jgi:hypothetical protein
MTEYTVPDCLVYKLEEYDELTDELDNTIYILYDKKEHNYIIRGKRKCANNCHPPSYSFVSKYENSVVDFLQYVICKSSYVDETLYNYDNLTNFSNDITYEYLNELNNDNNEISGYNEQKLGKKRLLKNIRMLRNVFNYYK